jgi:hypothetical protein
MMEGYGYGGMAGGMGGGGMGGAGHAIAGMIGGSLLWALAATLIGQVWLLGLNLVYLRITEGLDAGATEAALLRGLDDAKRRTAELGERAKAKATAASAAAAAAARDRERQSTAAAAPVDPATPIAPGTSPAAGGPVAPSAFGSPDAAASPYPSDAAFAPPAAPAAGPTFTPQPATIACPNCAALCTTDDLFCGVCGQRLK